MSMWIESPDGDNLESATRTSTATADLDITPPTSPTDLDDASPGRPPTRATKLVDLIAVTGRWLTAQLVDAAFGLAWDADDAEPWDDDGDWSLPVQGADAWPPMLAAVKSRPIRSLFPKVRVRHTPITYRYDPPPPVSIFDMPIEVDDSIPANQMRILNGAGDVIHTITVGPPAVDKPVHNSMGEHAVNVEGHASFTTADLNRQRGFHLYGDHCADMTCPRPHAGAPPAPRAEQVPTPDGRGNLTDFPPGPLTVTLRIDPHGGQVTADGYGRAAGVHLRGSWDDVTGRLADLIGVRR